MSDTDSPMTNGPAATAALAARLAAVRGQIARACMTASRDPATVELLAVSKTQAPERLRALAAQGITRFGENYAQELQAKTAALADLPLRFVFIGALQSNKIKLIVQLADEIQTVASERHARLVARHAAEYGKAPYPIYLAVNAGDEPQKHGLALAAAPALAALIARELPTLAVQGLMAIPPPLAAAVAAAPTPPPLYLELAVAARGVGAGRLSLGMSSDLALAIAAGSTCVRVGTALFGPRA